MHFRLVRPVKRKGSINHQFVQRIPADIKSRAEGQRLDIPLGSSTVAITLSAKADAVRLSLRTSDPAEVKIRQARIAAYLESVWRSLRADQPIPLSHRNAVALAKRAYSAWAEGRDRTAIVSLDMETRLPSSDHLVDEARPESLEAALHHLTEILDDDGRDLEPTFGPSLDAGLLAVGHGALEPASRRAALRAFGDAFVDGLAARVRQARGDYSPDPKAGRFPEYAPASKSPSYASLTGLVEAWWVEAKAAGRTQSTYESYRNTFARLTRFLQHDDAASVTPSDIVRFKDVRLAEGVSPKTVGDSDIAALRSVMDWAVSNHKLVANPAKAVKVKRPKSVVVRDKGFRADEATAILSHSLSYRRGRESAKTFAAKRWVPWLCAYTGARLGEMVQLRKSDLRKEGGWWVVTISPEAGTVKDKEVREVLLHSHLVETGFVSFVEAAPEGHLFIKPPKVGDARGVWRACKNRVTEFVREVVKDPNVAPNHGWRHAFKTVGREAGIADSVLDAICGHAAKSVGGSYGGVSLKTQQQAMAKFPRYAAEEAIREGTA